MNEPINFSQKENTGDEDKKFFYENVTQITMLGFFYILKKELESGAFILNFRERKELGKFYFLINDLTNLIDIVEMDGDVFQKRGLLKLTPT
jgi:hypothetical protein